MRLASPPSVTPSISSHSFASSLGICCSSASTWECVGNVWGTRESCEEGGLHCEQTSPPLCCSRRLINSRWSILVTTCCKGRKEWRPGGRKVAQLPVKWRGFPNMCPLPHPLAFSPLPQHLVHQASIPTLHQSAKLARCLPSVWPSLTLSPSLKPPPPRSRQSWPSSAEPTSSQNKQGRAGYHNLDSGDS